MIPDAQIDLSDALSDEWPDTPAGWATAHNKAELARDIVDVLCNNTHVRQFVDAVFTVASREIPCPYRHYESYATPHSPECPACGGSGVLYVLKREA